LTWTAGESRAVLFLEGSLDWRSGKQRGNANHG
jgi:hypothetical protein